ncbi:trans-2-enoyl-CoA reductase family protein [Vibrio sp. S11_S32]|uniref:enoyl-ACP reductase FabV n=1 Tax=Vibrio sp. S11_S32 TaxID=2720225 RepID=UPI001680BA01|nr:enoyl-ACP reductase FabV [Vibrio sp. S11_S32]MBD1576507.1 trans-2-enoyl-CoA reductase family protein [Vibrio sp. S11_S32]
MIIEPIIKGVVARSAHPYGCEAAVKQQIEFVKQAAAIKNGPKRVLILGASSGFGLASRIALAFGGSQADTIGVSFERGPSEKGVGTAGWYNNIFFKKEAEKEGRIAINIVGDAFAKQTRAQVVEAIETYFEGEVDLVIYSLATGMRPDHKTGEKWVSSIKPIGDSVTGASVLLEDDSWHESTVEAASDAEIESTLKVMGGSDWESWIDDLINSESLAEGCKTVAFSYIGSEITAPIYRDGTLGWAKVDLHQASHSLNLKMSNFNGSAHASVCKALVTKASVFIPTLTPYLIALYKVMKENGTHEGCIEQMQRLFTTKLYNHALDGDVQHDIPVDAERLIRIDDWELDDATQAQVKAIVDNMTADNFKQIGDYQGLKKEFMQINGFDFDNVDYNQDISIDELQALVD